jgi:hypothetical protein
VPHQAHGHPALACFKRALLSLGVITSAAVAPGTPRLEAEDAARFDEAFAEIRALSERRVGAPWVSVASGDYGAPRAGALR